MDEPTPPVIDNDHLRSSLTRAGLRPDFTRVQHTFVGRFSNDVWRLDLDNGVRLIAKRAWRNAESAARSDFERQFYAYVGGSPVAGIGAPHAADLPLPRYVGDFGGTLVLEYHDLRPFSFRRGATAEHAGTAIDALADWHAAWWGRPPRKPWLADYADADLRMAAQGHYDASWSTHRDRLLESAPEFAGLGDALVGRLAATLAPMAEPATMLHGDAHAENLPLVDTAVDDSRVPQALLLDWQEPCVANPGFDLAVFMSMSFDERQRGKLERGLVERHAMRVRALGCDWPDPWRDYRLGTLRRAARIVEIADAEFPSLSWVFRRSAIAALDNDAGALIR